MGFPSGVSSEYHLAGSQAGSGDVDSASFDGGEVHKKAGSGFVPKLKKTTTRQPCTTLGR